MSAIAAKFADVSCARTVCASLSAESTVLLSPGGVLNRMWRAARKLLVGYAAAFAVVSILVNCFDTMSYHFLMRVLVVAGHIASSISAG